MSAADSFAHLGYAVVRGAFAPSEVSEIVRWTQEAVKGRPPTPSVLFTHEAPAHPRALTELMRQHRNILRVSDDEARAVLEQLRQLVADVAGFEPVPLQDVLLSKPPGTLPFPWHQDLPYWPVDRTDGCVAWLALDHCTEENGALSFAVGSHLGALGPAIDLHTGAPQRGSSGAALALDRVACPTLEPGDVLLFHAKTWHRSGPNRTDRLRTAVSASFVHPAARWDHDRAPRHPLCATTVEKEPVAVWSQRMYHLARA